MFKILIADDEELSRSVIRCILEYYFKGKFLLFEASNGREAVCLALGERIDVAFLDIEMPVMDGLTAGWEIKQQHPSCSVIFLTAYAQFSYAKQAISMGAAEYLVKPAGEREVAEIITREMQRYHSEHNRSAVLAAPTPGDISTAPAQELAAGQGRAAKIAAEVRQLIDTQYRQEFSVEEIADRYQLSVNHFNKIFKDFNGMPFREYLINVRVEKAKEYLGNPQMNIREIGTLVGYVNPNYFSRIFKKKTGFTPIEYRNQLFFM